MFAGENVIKFVFQSAKSYYEKVVKVNLIPTNLPIIPVDATGVYPFRYEEQIDNPTPLPNDPKFVKQGSIYTTTEPFMNLFGTFDFIDLGDTYTIYGRNGRGYVGRENDGHYKSAGLYSESDRIGPSFRNQVGPYQTV